MANSVTRCPKCETSFRVTEAHLNSAKGSVRCGSCLHIFNARDYLLAEEPEPENDAIEEQVADDDDFLIDDNIEEDSGVYSSNTDSNVILASTFGPSEVNLFERELSSDQDDENENAPDESWVESLLEDDDDDTPQIIKPTPKEEKPKRELFTARDTQADKAGNFYGTEPPAPVGSSLSKDHFQLIHSLRDDDEHDAPNNNQQRNSGQTPNENNSQSIDERAYKPQADDENHIRDDEAPFDEIDEIDEIDEYAYDEPFGATSNHHYIHAIEPEPVEFGIHSHNPLWQSKSLWTGLALIAGLILVIQIAIFRFDDLSTVEPWRGYYAKACKLLSCTLPQLSDRSKIKATNLVVRSHPNIDNALMVDAILRNTARFPQGFPPLDLVFVDIKNKPLAARRFEASEYLGGELAGKHDMPVNQPIHIAIEIADPGADAVSYFITIPN